MSSRRKLWAFVGSCLLGAACLPAMANSAVPLPVIVIPPSDGACDTSKEDVNWLGRSLQAWQFVAAEKLKLEARETPQIIVFDNRCAYTLPAGLRELAIVSSALHGGAVPLPDGQSVPVSVVSFATGGEPGTPGFFVMAMPSVWRAAGVQSGLSIDDLTTGVMLHELMHGYQFHFANPALESAAKRYGLPDDINDDSLQAAFEDTPAYVADYEAERDLLYRSAAAADLAEARRLAAQALGKLRARRGRHFIGADAKWAPLDEIFLTMEGLGQWTMFAWLTDPRGRNLDATTAIAETRRGRKHWSQDEGLALFLVVDRLLPGWQKLAFGAEPETAEALLARAAGLRGSR